MTAEKRREQFRRYASPAAIGFGFVTGAVYALALGTPGGVFEARIALGLMFMSAGLMGLSYFLTAAAGRRELPYHYEQSIVFYFCWFAVGIPQFIRAFANDPLPESHITVGALYFFVGAVAGTVWLMALFLAIGLRSDVASWPVVRFPVWITDWITAIMTRTMPFVARLLLAPHLFRWHHTDILQHFRNHVCASSPTTGHLVPQADQR